MTLKPALSLLLIWTTLVTVLPTTAARTVTPQEVDASADTDTDGLRFRLSEGKETAAATPPSETTAQTIAINLSVAETRKLLARLPALKADASDTLDFKLREGSIPPPRAGETIQAAFAPPGIVGLPAGAITAAPLEITRFAPEGEVALAPNLSVTFSQPMVAVSSQAEAAAHLPIKITPQPQGKWRWIGNKTLMFQPDAEGGRLPMATTYTVTIPAGTKSAFGNALRETKTFAFATPPLQLNSFYPAGESKHRDALMFLEFDQRIDPARVLASLKIQPANSGTHLRLASQEEIAADPSISDLVKRSQYGRELVLRAVNSDGSTKDMLPANTVIKVVIPLGTPSAEGSRTTVAEQSFSFKTYGPMLVGVVDCGYEKHCSPPDRWQISFSNPLDLKTFQDGQVKITPEIPDVKINHHSRGIYIEGTKRSNTTYTVTFDRAIKDTFNQTLTGNNEVTFKVTTDPPDIFADGGSLVVLDPSGPRAFTVYSINNSALKVAIYKVTPDDWLQFRRYQGAYSSRAKETPAPPGRLVSNKIIKVRVSPDEISETAIDLSPALDHGYGHVFVRVEAIEPSEGPVNVYSDRQNMVEAWVESTDIALDAFVDQKELVAWANSLKDGSPLAGVAVSVSPDEISGVTGADGLAKLAFKVPSKTKEDQPALLVARRGKDVAILPQTEPHSYYSLESENNSWRRNEERDELRWYVFDDRKLYRPGEEVNIKGWIRQINLTPNGDTEMYTVEPGDTLNYVLQDSQDNELSKGSVKLNALAGFDFKVQLPAAMNLGGASVKFEFVEDGRKHTHSFQVQEFRRPEFELKSQVSEAPHFVGSSATVTLTAAYYAGGGLADTEVNWNVLATPTNYTPPNCDEYTFGKFYAWWLDNRYGGDIKEQSFEGRTDAHGNHTLKLDFDSVSPAHPTILAVAALVQEVNRQTISADTTLLVHPAAVYVGLKSSRSFVQQGEPFDITSIVTDLDGKALDGREVKLRLMRLDYVYEKGELKQQERDLQEQTVKSGTDAVSSRFQTTLGGMYRLTAQVRDDRERLNESEMSLWVAGGKLPPNREVTEEKVNLIPDRRTYKSNDVAEILVQSPFAPAEGIMAIRRSGLLSTERFTMKESSYTLRVPIAEAMTPNVEVQVDLVGAVERVDDEGNALANLPKRPAFASGEVKLEIPPETRRLSVKATPREAVLEPGAETMIDVEVKDANGRAVPDTDTAVIVVDESVLTLANYSLEDPLDRFYWDREEGVDDYHLRQKVTLVNPKEVRLLGGGGPGGGAGGGLRGVQTRYRSLMSQNVLNASSSTVNITDSAAEGQISVRNNFNALAVFAASLATDARGQAQVKVRLPDSLTRYRVIAVSVSGGKLAGSGESAITARKQLMARPSAPRFLNYGDTAELPVVLQNQTDQAMDVRLAVRGSNVTLTAGAGRQVAVPANNRVEVRFPIAAERPGMARFQIVATSGERTDAAEVSLPVYTPATSEAFATYGVIDDGSIAQPVKAPANAVKTFGGLEVTTASTQLQELTDAVLYLVNYPYGCSEQLASRVIAIAALKDVLAAFKAKEMPAPETMRKSVNAELRVLQSLQNGDGGFAFWRQGDPSVPYVSVHVAHALVRAKSKGFTVSAGVLESSRDYLRTIEKKIPDKYSVESRQAIQAYALFVRALMENRDAAKARKLIGDAGGVEKFSLESLGWLLPVVSADAASRNETDAIRRQLNNRVTETAGAAHFADSYSDGAYTILHSDRRADGVVLDALIGDQPQSDLIPKLVRGLLSNRQRGHWSNTQENVFILLALGRYFETYENTTPDFVARVWLGDGYAGEQIFKGRSIDRQQLNLPMSQLVARTANASANLTIGKEGAGRLYYRIGTQYAPEDLKIAAADYGFVIERKYEAIDDPTDVQMEADGGWLIKAGARVRVRVTMSNPARRFHVALVDPLPAGIEPLNPELATTERLPEESREEGIKRGGSGIFDYYWNWRGTWYEHQNLRDERVEAFTSLLWEGVHEYTYFARATTPGLFVVPPPKAEEMYAPETFGRGHSDRVRVK